MTFDWVEFHTQSALEAELAEHEAHEDTLAMESIEEQDLAEEVGLHTSA